MSEYEVGDRRRATARTRGSGLFPSYPDGAHAVGGPGRVVMFSASGSGASISVYPDSDKLGVRPAGGGEDRLDFRRDDAVDYWEGE